MNEIVSEKDKKCGHLFAEGAAVQLLLHSDETYVHAYCHKHLKQGLELTFGRFERVWLLLSPVPASNGRKESPDRTQLKGTAMPITPATAR